MCDMSLNELTEVQVVKNNIWKRQLDALLCIMELSATNDNIFAYITYLFGGECGLVVKADSTYAGGPGLIPCAGRKNGI